MKKLTLSKARGFLAVFTSLALAFAMFALPCPPAAHAATKQDINVQVTNTSGNFVNGYWVEYKINGITYRSDTAGTRINQIAWDHMTNGDRKKTMEDAFGWMIHIRKRQFSPEFSGKMAEWYDTYSGWVEARQIFADRLAQINFPEYQAHYAGNNRYTYRENFEPSFSALDCDDFPETMMLYKELEACWKWACETYDAMSRAQQIQTGMAVSSISGDLIKLITDRCLVPNITPSGVSSGLASKVISLSTEIFGIYDGILGNLDNIQAKVIGEKMDAESVRIVIESLSDVISQDKAIIDKCETRMRELKSQIEQKLPALREAEQQKNQALVNAEEAEVATVRTNSPITGTAASGVATTINNLIAEYEAIKRSNYETEAEYNAARTTAENRIKSYCQTTYDTAVTNLTDWCNTYFGTTAVASYTEDSVVGAYVKSFPKEPKYSSASNPQEGTTQLSDKTMQSIGTFPDGKGLDVYMTSDELSTVESEVASYAQSYVEYNQARITAYQSAQASATAARSAFSPILSTLNAVEDSGRGYFTATDAQQTVVGNMSAYLTMINAYGNLGDISNEGGLYPRSLSGDQWIKLRDCGGSIAWAQEQKAYYDTDGEFLTLFATAKAELLKAQANIARQTAVFKHYEDEYAQAWQEYRDLDAERQDILGGLSEELEWVCGDTGNNTNDAWNSKFYYSYRVEPQGTMEDVERVGAESAAATQGLLVRDAQLGQIAWRIQMYADTLENLSTRTSPYGNYKETYGIGSVLEANTTNATLNSGATPWEGITEQGWSDWGEDGGYADGIRNAYIFDNLSYSSTIPGNIYAEEQLTSISTDCEGKSFTDEGWIEIFSNLNDNYTEYTTTKSDDEGGYEDQKRVAERLRNGGRMGGIDRIIAKANLPRTEPDPKDLAEPWFEDIDAARIANGVEAMPLEKSGAVVEPIPDQAFCYDYIRPVPVVRIGSKQLELDTDFELYYVDNYNIGTATVYIDGIGKYTGELQTTFKIVEAPVADKPAEPEKPATSDTTKPASTTKPSSTPAAKTTKKANPMVVKGLKKTVKLGKAKKLKKAKTVKGAVKFTKKPKGTVTYTRISKGSSKRLTIAKKTGKVTIKKGTKAGTYKLKVKVKAAGTSKYKSKTQKVTITIQVKKVKK